MELKDLENESSTTAEMYEQNNCEVSVTNSSESEAKSRRTCWVSNENHVTPNFDLNSATTTVKTPKKVNFQSLDEVSKNSLSPSKLNIKIFSLLYKCFRSIPNLSYIFRS